MRVLHIAAATGLVAAAVFGISRGAPALRRSLGDKPLPDPSDLGGQVEELRAEVANLRKQRTALAPVVLSMNPPSSPPSAPISTEEADRLFQESMVKTARDLDERLAGEWVDAAWSAQAAKTFRDVFRADVPGTELHDAHCGSTVCKLSLSHDSTDSQRDFPSKITSKEPFKPGVYYHYHPEATPPRTEIYVLRGEQNAATP